MRSCASWLEVSVVCLAVVACVPEEPPQAERDPVGGLELALTSAPQDAACLRITVSGSRVVSRALDLVPGQSTVVLMERLPVGLVTIDASAFDVPCVALGPNNEPNYLSQAPVIVRIDHLQIARVTLGLSRNGRSSLVADFEQVDTTAAGPVRLAIIGDTPYGATQIADLPNLIAHINADARVDRVVHVGDFKNGSSRCDTSYFQLIAQQFSTFADPFIFTPGDNEWTDCHRLNNGLFDPLERLAAIRALFFPQPGLTLGAPRAVLSQASIPAHATFVENRLWMDAAVVFSTVHVVGSSNGMAPWFVTDTTGMFKDDPDRRIAEVEARTAAALDWIDRSFDLARSAGARGVAVFMQADTFLGSSSGFASIIRRLADRARAFGGPVLLVQGDSHTFLVDRPLATPNALYQTSEGVPNLTRVVVQGETTAEWLLLEVDPAAAQPFSWQRIMR